MHILIVSEQLIEHALIFNGIDVVVALLYHSTTSLHEGLQELLVRVWRGITTFFILLYMLHARLGSYVYSLSSTSQFHWMRHH